MLLILLDSNRSGIKPGALHLAAVPFTATVAIFGATELLGHLPFSGVLLAFLVLGSREETSLALSGLRQRPHVRIRSDEPV